MFVDVVGDVCAVQSHLLGIFEIAFHLAVKSVPHPFEHDVAVAIDSWTLSHGCNLVEYLVDVSHIEVAAEAEVFCLPVVSAKKWVYIF